MEQTVVPAERMVCLASNHVENGIEKNVKINRLAIFSVTLS